MTQVNLPESKIVYYCKDCEKLITGKQVGRTYVYRCPICNTKNVAFGTLKSIKNFYHIEPEPENDSEDDKV